MLKNKYLLVIVIQFLIIIVLLKINNNQGQKTIKDEKNDKIIKMSEQELNDCIDNYKIKINSRGFVYGELMIGFKDKRKIMQAREIFEKYGLIINNNDLIDYWDFSTAEVGFLLTKVPIGDEFKWKCILENDSDILGVNLNHIVVDR